MKSIILSLPYLGYTIHSREITFARDRADSVLTPRLQKIITKAVRNDNTITIVKHAASCPYCGKEIPAYSDYFTDEQLFYERSQSEIEKWATYQLSFLGEKPKELLFNKPIESIPDFICPKCGKPFRQSNGEHKVVIKEKNKKITIELELEIEDLFSLNWTKRSVFDDTEELYESITFNLRNGHTYLTLTDSSGKRYETLDITEMNTSGMRSDPVIYIIENYKHVYRELKHMLQPHWNGQLPFSETEINIERYILLTRLVGYDRAFYKEVPFAKTENQIEKSFAIVAKALHYSKNVPEMYEKSALPQVKSIKRIIFSRPSYLFYRAELEKLWLLLDDVNYFRRILESQSVNFYKALAYLHNYPLVFNFLSEYAECSGNDNLFIILTDKYSYWRQYAPKYLAMSEYIKCAERKKWQDKNYILRQKYDLPACVGECFSIPIPVTTEYNAVMPLDGTIKGYTFLRLCNSHEYQKAGMELHNCLINWKRFNGMVYGIIKNGKYVAAVELDGKETVQAYKAYNKDIDTDKPLFAAYSTWKEQNGLV